MNTFSELRAPFRFDGHGVNDAHGNRLATLTKPSDYNDMNSAEWKNHRRIGELLGMAPTLLGALEDALVYMHEANSRIEYTIDNGVQYGGNQYCNPVFKELQTLIDKAKGVK